MRCLLDKNVVRHAIAGLYFGSRRPLSRLEMDALSFWRAAEEHSALLFPYHKATLPRLATPSEMVMEWESGPPSTIG